MPSFRQGFFNLLNSQKKVQQFTPEALKEIYQHYRDSVGLSQDITEEITSSKAFDDHVANRIQNHTGFKSTFGPSEEDTLAKLLKEDTPKNIKIKETFKTILEPQDFYTESQKIYKESMEFFKKRIYQAPELSTETLGGYLREINATARNALKAQQIHEQKLLKDKAPELALKIGKVLGVATDPAQLKKIEDNLINDLAKSHKDQLTAFDKTAQANVTVFDKASALENKQMLFTGMLESWTSQLSDEQRDEMEKEMMRAREKNLERRNMALGEEFTGLIADDEENTLSAINPDDLNFVISLTGAKIKRTQDGMWTVHLSARILDPLYYLSPHQNPKVEMLTMAQLVRASGSDSITFIVKFDDPKTAKQRFRQAYKAALESGFDPGPLPGQDDKEDKDKVKGIYLKDGKGKVRDPLEFFTQGELDKLHEQAKEKRKKLDGLLKKAPQEKPSEATTKQYREDVTKGRDKIREEARIGKINQEAEKDLQKEIEEIIKTAPH